MFLILTVVQLDEKKSILEFVLFLFLHLIKLKHRNDPVWVIT